MTHGSLFSGIGGFDLAAQWMGWENVFHCEWNPFGQKVLKHYWPKAISYNDITKTNFTIHRGRIDILTGGFPCQPYSMAGKRLGKEDDRHLWPEMLRAIREIQPRWVVGENVHGIVNWSGGLVFHELQTDLEAEGYEVQPFVLPAVSVNAPHRRDRVWFVAYAKSNGDRGELPRLESPNGCQREPKECWQNNYKFGDNGEERFTSDTESEQGEWMQSEQRKFSEQKQGEFGGNGIEMGGIGTAPDTDSRATRTPGEGGGIESNGSENNGQQGERGESTEQHHRPYAVSWDAPDTSNTRLQGSKKFGGVGAVGKELNEFATRCVPPTWQNFPTQSPICDGNDGISAQLDGITFSKWRQESIKAGGNAVVPQVVLQIFRTIEDYENQNT